MRRSAPPRGACYTNGMDTGFDFAGYSSDGRLRLVVETKVRQGTNTEWARLFRQNLLEMVPTVGDAMFLLATPETLYLWKSGAQAHELATFETDATAIFGPYFKRAGVNPDKAISPSVFDLVVDWWLQDRTRGAGPTDDTLEQAGFSAVLRGGRVVHQAAA